ELFARNRRRWLRALPRWARAGRHVFRRGFVAGVTCAADSWLAGAGDLLHLSTAARGCRLRGRRDSALSQDVVTCSAVNANHLEPDIPNNRRTIPAAAREVKNAAPAAARPAGREVGPRAAPAAGKPAKVEVEPEAVVTYSSAGKGRSESGPRGGYATG